MRPPLRLVRRLERRRADEAPPSRGCSCGHDLGVHEAERQHCLVEGCLCELFRGACPRLEALR